MGQLWRCCFGLWFLVSTIAGDSQVPLLGRQKSRNFLDKDFDDVVSELLKRYHALGLSVSIVDRNDTYAKGYGLAALPDKVATAKTLYYTGSTTKSFTTAAFLQLIEESANSSSPLKLSTPISSIIRDDFVLTDEYTTQHATFEDALSHRTGMPRHDNSYGGPNFSPRDLVRSMRYLPVSAELRATFQYCNLMFVAVSHVIETLTKSWLGDVLKERIWSPLGMQSTFFSIADAKASEARGGAPLSVPYSYFDKSDTYERNQYVDDPCVSGAGAVISNVLDYATYLRAMMYMNSTLLSRESFMELRTPRTFEAARPESGLSPIMYSLGWEMNVYRGVETFYHGGAVTGYGAQMLYIPELEWGFATMSNTDLNSNLIATVLTYVLLDRLVDTPKEKRINWDKLIEKRLSGDESEFANARKRLYPDAPEKKKSRPPTLPLKDYTGTYFNDGYRDLTIGLTEDTSSKAYGAQILHSKVRNRTWQFDIDYEHVTADYFVAKLAPSPEDPSTIFYRRDAHKAEFRIGVDGKVKALGIGWEKSLESMIWYGKKN